MGNEYVDIQMGRALGNLITGGMARRAEESAIDSWEKAAKGWEARAIREQERKEEATSTAWRHFVKRRALERLVADLVRAGSINQADIDRTLSAHQSAVLDEYPQAVEHMDPPE